MSLQDAAAGDQVLANRYVSFLASMHTCVFVVLLFFWGVCLPNNYSLALFSMPNNFAFFLTMQARLARPVPRSEGNNKW